MKTPRHPSRRRPGFTLIELLVVISIIGILAALMIPGISRAKQKMALAKAQTQLAKVETAIDSYKAKLGIYPPDNLFNRANVPNSYATNQLYYELSGCTLDIRGTNFTTLNGAVQISTNLLGAYFGSSLVVNHTRVGGGDDGAVAQPFLKDLGAGQYGGNVVRFLGTSVDGPLMFGSGDLSINPFRYNSSNPTNNPNSFDLWVDVLVGGKTNRINNWTKKPIIL